MLFSNDQIAEYINNNFEPTWQSVRPVPVVRIDFGDGNVMTRTLHGNIATYICNADAHVYDVLPGLYQPSTYLEQLEQMLWLTQFVAGQGESDRLSDYHQRQASALKDYGRADALVRYQGGRSITGRELGVEYVLQPARRLNTRARASRKGMSMYAAMYAADKRVARPELLQQDTRINETVRRKLIHEHLATRPKLRPAEMQTWLYREVLKADLDDPLLGLGGILGSSEPTIGAEKRQRQVGQSLRD